MPTLTAIDVLGIQRYIFASNRLRDAVACSYQVYWATKKDGGLQAGDGPGLPEDAVLLAAGGTAILRFADRDRAKDYAAAYTRCLFDQVPGLEVVLVHRDYEEGELAGALIGIQGDLLEAKNRRRPAIPLLGLGVTAACRATGLPATGFDFKDPERAPLAASLVEALDRLDQANKRWESYLSPQREESGGDLYRFPLEMDSLGRTEGDTSFLGVVHIDGNGFGRKIANWLQKMASEHVSDDELRRRYAGLSEGIATLGEKALKAVVARIHGRIEQGTRPTNRRIAGAVPSLDFDLKPWSEADKSGWYLPLRPLILGGDDLTFVCDGRLALDLAVTALEVFEAEDHEPLGKLHGCAGIALVHTHFPFARAYDWAETLCASAKGHVIAAGRDGSALDWHIGAPLPNQPLDELRRRQYLGADRQRLTQRPYHLGTDPQEPRSWRFLSQTLLDSPKGLRSERWKLHRNKVQELAKLVREGPGAIEGSLQAWRVAAPQLAFPEPLSDRGFKTGPQACSTPLLDGVELLDLHLPLEAPPEKRTDPKETTT